MLALPMYRRCPGNQAITVIIVNGAKTIKLEHALCSSGLSSGAVAFNIVTLMVLLAVVASGSLHNTVTLMMQ